MIATPPTFSDCQMTIDQFLALPDDDGFDRMLIQGRLWEKPFRFHTAGHGAASASIAAHVGNWVRSVFEPRGRVFARCGFILREVPASVTGIDVAYASAQVVSRRESRNELIEGCPVLAVKILSPGDKFGEIIAQVREYLAVGVALIWVVEPEFQTVTVYRPGKRTKLYSETDILSGGDAMPGFEITVNQIFED